MGGYSSSALPTRCVMRASAVACFAQAAGGDADGTSVSRHEYTRGNMAAMCAAWRAAALHRGRVPRCTVMHSDGSTSSLG